MSIALSTNSKQKLCLSFIESFMNTITSMTQQYINAYTVNICQKIANNEIPKVAITIKYLIV